MRCTMLGTFHGFLLVTAGLRRAVAGYENDL